MVEYFFFLKSHLNVYSHDYFFMENFLLLNQKGFEKIMKSHVHKKSIVTSEKDSTSRFAT